MSDPAESKQERQKKLLLQRRFSKRITIARQGREAFMERNNVGCMQKYQEYLLIIAESKNTDDIFKLNPSMFDDTTQLSELLLISHVFWEMARIYEMTPKLQMNFQNCLNQFVKFTTNQPYQVLNAEMMRKYNKMNAKRSRYGDKYIEAYSQIFVQSKSCYIASHCFGYDAMETIRLRRFKDEILLWPLGEYFVAIYYRCSSKLVDYLDHKPLFSSLLSKPIKPILLCFSLFTETSIFKRCSYYLKLLQKNGSSH